MKTYQVSFMLQERFQGTVGVDVDVEFTAKGTIESLFIDGEDFTSPLMIRAFLAMYGQVNFEDLVDRCVRDDADADACETFKMSVGSGR